MRLHLLLLALALGCATEDAKTDDTSSNGGSGDGGSAGDGGGGDESEDMGNLLSQVAGMVTEMAEMSAKIAAQQATIAQLEMQMAETLRWETFEHTCVAEDGSEESTGVTADGAVIASAFRYFETQDRWDLEDGKPDSSDGVITVECYSAGRVFVVTVGYER